MSISTDVKLFIYTKHLYAIHEEHAQVSSLLQSTLGQSEEFWENWLHRYQELAYSKEIQIMLLREAGYTYKGIQDALGVSPSTVAYTLNNYELDYGGIEGALELVEPLTALEARLQKAVTPIWK